MLSLQYGIHILLYFRHLVLHSTSNFTASVLGAEYFIIHCRVFGDGSRPVFEYLWATRLNIVHRISPALDLLLILQLLVQLLRVTTSDSHYQLPHTAKCQSHKMIFWYLPNATWGKCNISWTVQPKNMRQLQAVSWLPMTPAFQHLE